MGKKKIEGPIAVPVITIDYRRYLELEASEEKLIAGSTISGLNEEEYGEATVLLLQRALNNREVFTGSVRVLLDNRYEATITKVSSISPNMGPDGYTTIIKFSKIEK